MGLAVGQAVPRPRPEDGQPKMIYQEEDSMIGRGRVFLGLRCLIGASPETNKN